MLSREDATALVAHSRLFDVEWYSRVSGRPFGSRAAAVAAWVASPGESSPHPLFEPLWLYPGGGWRGRAPDPLSFYLQQVAAGSRPARSPHPLYDHDTLGPLEDWLVEHDPTDLLPDPVARAVAGATALVRLDGDDVRRAVRWVRHLARFAPRAVVSLEVSRPGARRVLESVAAARPRVHVESPAVAAETPVVTIDAGLDPPRWAWLPPLLEALARPGVAVAQPVLVDADFLVVAPVLVGHPVSAIDRLDGATLPARFPGIEARSPGRSGGRVLVTRSWVTGTAPAPGEAWTTLERRARERHPVEGLPSLHWSIDIAAGAVPLGRRWGDWHFARSLADALERLGQWVEIDHPETRSRATRSECDVVLTLRGLERVPPAPGATTLLWVISHPDTVSPDEIAEHDVAFAASTTWADRHGITPLLQCTDATRFHPHVGSSDAGAGVLFVGNARGGVRPVVAAARAAGVATHVIGTGWAEHGVEAAADRIANTDLPAAYASAGIVLNDHHADMAAQGFVSNRVFDVLAVGGRLLSDPVAGLDQLLGSLGTTLPSWETPDDLARLTKAPYDAWPGDDERLALAGRVVAEHSFDARARTLLDAALSVRQRGG